MSGHRVASRATLDRRKFLLTSTSALAAAGLGASIARPETTEAHAPMPLVAEPQPIPGGTQIPDGPFIHLFSPGPEGLVLPHTGVVLEGLDVEPTTITDYQGFTAQAYLIGTATGSDGREYNAEVDIRPYQGTYIAADGSQHEASFMFI